MSVDVITCEEGLSSFILFPADKRNEDLCFGNSVDAINAPNHEAPIVLAMDASLPAFVCFKHSSLYKGMIMNCPPNISKVVSPATAGLVDLQLVSSELALDFAKATDHR
jgi:hypothetical protein